MTQTQNVFADVQASARLGDSHGYRIHGDLACLNAELAIHESRRALAEQWALQLWACDAPYGGGALRGMKIAEAPLAVSGDVEPQRHYAEAFARLPAGDREYSMVLVLASGAKGEFDRVHDFANYPAREHFTVPKLHGAVAAVAAVDGTEQVTLRVESVENPRATENLSGTLALEVWGLEERYNGGPFTGAPLAGVELGRLAGGASLPALEHTLTLAATSSPYPHCVLMLREWTATGYVTRDFRELSELPLEQAPAPELSVAHAPKAPESASVGVVAVEPEMPAQPVVEAQPLPSNNQGLVSASHGSLDELAAVPGLNRKLASEIIKARPFRHFEDLMRVRGIGEKVLRRLRSVLTV